MERGSHAGRSGGSRRDDGNVVERSSHVDGGSAPPRLLVRRLMGRSELQGGTAGRSSDSTVLKRIEETRPGAVLKGPMKLGVEQWVARKSLGPVYGDISPVTEIMAYKVFGN